MAHTHTMGIAAMPDAEENLVVPQFYAGESPAAAHRDVLILAARGAIPQYSPLKSVAGVWTPWVVADAAPVSGITLYAIPDLAVDQRAAVVVAGMINIDAVAWPAGTSEIEVETAQAGSPLQFRKLLYSDQREIKGDLAVGPDAQPPPEVAP
jgi:hypothetical protein